MKQQYLSDYNTIKYYSFYTMSSTWRLLWISYVRIGSASSWGLVQVVKKSPQDKNEGMYKEITGMSSIFICDTLKTHLFEQMWSKN